MVFTKDSLLKARTTVAPSVAKTYCEARNAVGAYAEYIDAIWTWSPGLQISALAVFGQWADETDVGRSARWLNGDPAGIGIYSDDTASELKPHLSGEESAAVHLTELSAKIERVVPPASKVGGIDVAAIDPHLVRVKAMIKHPKWPDVITLNDLRKPLTFSPGNFVWAANQSYGEQIARHMNAVSDLASSEPDQGGSAVAIVAEKPKIEIWVVSGPQNNRPALPMPSPSYVTVHEVGNTSPGADEDMHAQFVHNGGGSSQVSFHFIVGPTKAIQLIYLNENAWHASDYYGGRGNRDSIAIETVQIGDFNKTLNHLTWLIAELFRNPARWSYRTDVPTIDDLKPEMCMERIKQHNYWAPDHKNCPQFIRSRGQWEPLLNAVRLELTETVPPMAGTEVAEFTPPILPGWWDETAVNRLGNHSEDGVKYRPLGSRITALKKTGAYAHGWDPKGKGKATRPAFEERQTTDLRYIAERKPGDDAWGILKTGSWVALKYWTPHFEIEHQSSETAKPPKVTEGVKAKVAAWHVDPDAGSGDEDETPPPMIPEEPNDPVVTDDTP